MLIVFTLFVSVAALLHVIFFKLESIDFMKERILKRFGLNQAQGTVVKIWAFNQGFYNLFLAFGLFYSLFLVYGDHFWVSDPKKYPAAFAQAVPAFLGFVSSFFL